MQYMDHPVATLGTLFQKNIHGAKIDLINPYLASEFLFCNVLFIVTICFKKRFNSI